MWPLLLRAHNFLKFAFMHMSVSIAIYICIYIYSCNIRLRMCMNSNKHVASARYSSRYIDRDISIIECTWSEVVEGVEN